MQFIKGNCSCGGLPSIIRTWGNWNITPYPPIKRYPPLSGKKKAPALTEALIRLARLSVLASGLASDGVPGGTVTSPPSPHRCVPSATDFPTFRHHKTISPTTNSINLNPLPWKATARHRRSTMAQFNLLTMTRSVRHAEQ